MMDFVFCLEQRPGNFGWRIDVFYVSKKLAESHVIGCDVHPEVRCSFFFHLERFNSTDQDAIY